MLFQKDYYFNIVNQKVLENIANLTQKLYEEFYKQNKCLILIYIFIFIVLVVDLSSLLITLSSNSEYKKKAVKSSSWQIIFPLIVEWIITIGFYINFKIRKKKMKSKVQKLMGDRKKDIKCYNEERATKISKTLKLQGRHFKNTYFENLLITILLFFLPIIIKNIILRKAQYQVIFAVSASLFYGYDIILGIIKLIIKLRRQQKYNKDLCSEQNKDKYNSISVLDNNNNKGNIEENNLSLEDIDININDNIIFEKNNKMKSKLGECFMNISFLFAKCFMEILFIIYFIRIGEKLDNKMNSTTWVILFIPIYIIFFPLLLFCIFHYLSLYATFKEKIWLPIITIFPCLFVFIANFVIIPLKLDNKINFNEIFITIFFVIGTGFLCAHLIILNKYKK